MNTIAIAIISTGAIGLACAVLITVASKLMFVKVDVRVEKIRNCLSGANCGACGFSSCDSYAEALVKGDTATNLCPPGGDDALNQINNILGVSESEGLTKKLAIVHCMGDSNTKREKMEYSGINTCYAANHLYGGEGACTFGCVGFGDCVKVCPSDAICLEDNLARVDTRRCSGCELCEKVCPTGIISIELEPVNVAVFCMNTEKGAVLKDKCSKGCIGCMKCVKECHAGAITVSESLASIDYSKCDNCGKCVDVCVKKCIAKW